MMGPITVDGVQVTVRPVEPDDAGFIVACTLQSARPRLKVQSERDRRSLASVVRHLVQTVDACVAHDVRDPGRLVGFALGVRGDSPHWVYVSHSFRGHGIARLLVSFLNQ